MNYTANDMIAARKAHGSENKQSPPSPQSICKQKLVDPIYWGDEVEGHVVELNQTEKRVGIVVDGLEYLFSAISEAHKEYP